MSFLQKILRRLSGKSEPTLTPDGINFQQAQQWFKDRHQVYVRLTNVVAEYIPANGVVFDIGANIGYFSALLAEKISFSGTIHLFEPIPNLASLCQKTFENKPYTTHVHQIALSDEDGSFEIFAARDGNIGWNTMVAEKAHENMQRISIEAKTFAQTNISEIPDVIKIDVEGAEFKVLLGLIPAMKTWAKLPVILCEVGWGKSHPNWDQELAAFAALETMGYASFDLDKQPFDVATLEKTTDILFMPTAN